MDEVLKKVIEIAAEQLGLDEDDIVEESNIYDDLGADSLDFIEIVMALEDEYNIELPDEDVEEFLTINDFATYMQRRLS